jgi:putative endonuclease
MWYAEGVSQEVCMGSAFTKGREGEDRAAAELGKQGMAIIERNFHSAVGEVDLIGVENETLVFIEVKNWKSLPFEGLEQSLNRKKQQKIIETAKYFILKHREYSGMAVRFDIVFIGRNEFHHIASVLAENV